jgi:hypothetical protein
MSKDSLISQMVSDSSSGPDHLDQIEDSALDGISKLAHDAGQFEEKIEDAESLLKSLKVALHKITDEQLPELLEEMNLQKFTLTDGAKISVKPIYAASIPKTRKAEAFGWLRDNGFGDLVKNNVSVTFGRGEDTKATDFIDFCRGLGFSPDQLEKVEPMTLKAWLREQVEAGHPIPLDLFGAFISQRATIKRSK